MKKIVDQIKENWLVILVLGIALAYAINWCIPKHIPDHQINEMVQVYQEINPDEYNGMPMYFNARFNATKMYYEKDFKGTGCLGVSHSYYEAIVTYVFPKDFQVVKITHEKNLEKSRTLYVMGLWKGKPQEYIFIGQKKDNI
ncbi:MAG: hypothetical protein R3Y43_03465 [Alphaproteobacteria bacterium]